MSFLDYSLQYRRILDRLSIRAILPSHYRLYSDALVTPITSSDSVVIMEIVSVMRWGGR